MEVIRWGYGKVGSWVLGWTALWKTYFLGPPLDELVNWAGLGQINSLELSRGKAVWLVLLSLN